MHRMDLVWYQSGLFFQNSHTCSFPQKRSSATATSTSEALKCLSRGLRVPLMALHFLEGTSRKNLPHFYWPVISPWLFYMTGPLVKGFLTSPYFQEELWIIKLPCSAQGWIHPTWVVGSGWGQWAMFQSRIFPSYWQSYSHCCWLVVFLITICTSSDPLIF